MKVVILNVKYSPNLGDGVIAECLEHALARRLSGAEITSCDLAGRGRFEVRSSALRQVAIKILAAAPSSLSALLSRVVIGGVLKRSLTPFYKRQLAGADIVIVGGGQLFADANLNFPAKLNAALGVAKDNDARIVVHAVGVDHNWSEPGRKLFRGAMAGANIAKIAVRDVLSQNLWREHFTGCDLPPPQLRLDPALLAEAAYGPARLDKAGPRPRAGLCVTAPGTLDLHSSDSEVFGADVRTFFINLAERLRRAGFDVLAFTNGASDDDALLKTCFPAEIAAEGERGALIIAPRAVKPGELVATIGSADVIVGHRLHANIIAYALGVPHVGLAWNPKINEFFDLTGRRDFLLAATPDNVGAAAEKTRTALAQGLDPALRLEIIGRAEEDICALAADIKAAANRV